jgi:uncharacterized damage-inducible protein DinB
MRRRTIFAAAAAALPAEAQWTNPFAEAFLKSFVAHWKDTREYTLSVLAAMPAEKFTTKASPAQRTFGEQLLHIATANTAYFRGFALAEAPALKAPDAADKAAVRAFVVAHFDFSDAVLAKMNQSHVVRNDIQWSPRQPKHSTVDIFLRAYMHTAHHRGQIISYLRVVEITPPTWKFEPHA